MPQRLLHLWARAVYPCLNLAAGVCPPGILLYLKQSCAVLIDDYQIDWAAALRGRDTPHKRTR